MCGCMMPALVWLAAAQLYDCAADSKRAEAADGHHAAVHSCGTDARPVARPAASSASVAEGAGHATTHRSSLVAARAGSRSRLLNLPTPEGIDV